MFGMLVSMVPPCGAAGEGRESEWIGWYCTCCPAAPCSTEMQRRGSSPPSLFSSPSSTCHSTISSPVLSGHPSPNWFASREMAFASRLGLFGLLLCSMEGLAVRPVCREGWWRLEVILGREVVMDAIAGLVFCKLLVCRLVFSGIAAFGACMLPVITAVVEILLLKACFTSFCSGTSSCFDFLFFCFRAEQVFLCRLKTL